MQFTESGEVFKNKHNFTNYKEKKRENSPIFVEQKETRVDNYNNCFRINDKTR